MSEPCTQAENIRRINEMLVGNGHPEDGLAFKVRLMTENHTQMYEIVKDIQISVKELKEQQESNFQTNAGNIARTQNAVDLSIKEMAAFQNGVKSEKDVENKKFQRSVKLIGLVIAGIGVIAAVIGLFNYSGTSKIPALETKVDRMNKPIMDVKRGLYYFPISDSIYRMDTLRK